MEGEAGPLFRANKRRKVIRKKASSGDDDQNGSCEDQTSDSPAVEQQSEQIGISNLPQEDVQARAQSNLARVRRPKRHGIAFNSSSSRPRDSSDERSDALAENRVPELVQQSKERFVKPTGKAVVTDDRHMSAFIDSRLAELRHAGTSVANQQMSASDNQATSQSEPQYAKLGNGPISEASHALRTRAGTVDRANTSSKSKYTRPTRRRQPPARPEADVARDSMVDQIMRESQVSHYDQTTAQQAPRLPVTEDGGEVDRDAAAAAAFKADFLAAAQERNYHRRAPVNPTQGPKLGGSRSARERMKAMEDAQKGSGKTGKP